MASFPEGPLLEIYHGHKREQSQDSGAYIDWNSEDSTSPTGNLDAIAKGEFVTVVAVESNGGEEAEEVSPFVTVLEINDEDGKVKGKTLINANEDIEEEVLVYRLPGERLGFGLKFEGGTNTAENVKRLFIQSSAPDSPASRAECSWGALAEGDEIIRIDGHEVKEMTRLDCVRCLKESSVVIKLYVRHPGRVEKQSAGQSDKSSSQSSTSPLVISAEMKKKVPPPPPIPPRKIPRKVLAPLQKDEVATVSPPEGFGDAQQVPLPKVRSLQNVSEEFSASKNQSKSSVFVPAKEVKQDLGENKRMSKRNVFDLKHIPPEPEVYLDILAQEDVKNNCESESDDTGSTISTVMGFSLSTTTNSSFSDLRSNASSYCDSTTPSTPTSTPSTPVLDAAKVLIPHQNPETNDFLFIKMINDKGGDSISYDEKASVCSDDNVPLQPPLSFQDAPLSYGNEEIKVSLSDAMETPKEDAKAIPDEASDDAELCCKGNSTKSTGSSKKTSLIPRLAKSIGLITTPPKPSPRKETGAEKRSNKKRPPPPPPPPPRSDRPRCPQPEPEPKTLKSSIPYLKKKKTKSEAPKSEKKAKVSEKTGAATDVYVPEETEKVVPEAGQTAEPEPEPEPEPESQNLILSWPVPELKNRRQQNDLDMDTGISRKNDADAQPEQETGSDAFGSEFAMDAAASRDPYFLFQWGSSKHLETIGEDEEDGCAEDVSLGQHLEEAEEKATLGKTDVDVKVEATKPEITAERVEEVPITETKESETRETVQEAEEGLLSGREPATKAAGEESPPQEVTAAAPEGDIGVDVAQNQDGSVIREAGRKNQEGKESSCDSNGLKKPGRETVPNDVTADTQPSNGGMKEKMVPIVSAAVGLAPPPTFSRLPPDGHEFPQNYQEESIGMPAKLREESSLLYEEELKSELPPLPTSEPPAPQKYSFRLDGNVDILPSKKTLPGDILEDSPLARPSRTSFWRQDERSEKSVRDKIAMFSSVPDSPVGPANSFCSGKLSKYKSSDDVFYDDDADCVRNLPNGKHFSRSIVSIDKIGGLNNHVRNYSKKCGYSESPIPPRSLDYANRTQSSMDLTSSSSSAYSSSCSPDSSLSSTTSSYLGYSSTLPRKSSRSEGAKSDAGQKAPGITRATSFSLHGRSQSLLDINPSPYKSRFKPDGAMDDEQKQYSLNLLIEQRRKNLSKLRGLVIPEKLPDTPPSQPIFDLPEIKSRELILTPKLANTFKEESRSSQSKWENPISQSNSSLNLTSPPWKAQSKSPNVPKYSPAFKRKAISVYGSAASPAKKDPPESLKNGETERLKAPAKPPRSLPLQNYDGLIGGKSRDQLRSPPPLDAKYSPERYVPNELTRTTEIFSATRRSQGKYRNSDPGRSEEDSDNDSAVSSSRSSISHGFSPPSSPLLDNQHQSVEELPRQLYVSPLLTGEKSPLVRTLSSETTASGASNTSTLTSGSQASCSSNGGSSSDCNSKRILKAQSVEAINRKNVLASAKYSRGFDVKSGSPLIQRKFIASSDKESSYEDTNDDKESVLSFGSSCTIESYPNLRKYSNASPKSETVNYKLPTEIGQLNPKSTDVKIAFINEVAEVCGITEKKKLVKTESSPCQTSLAAPKGRRTSVPLAETQWSTEEGWLPKKSESFDNGHLPLTGKPSTESLRSRASSVDTIVENVLVNENGLDLVSPRLKPPRHSIETDVKRIGTLDISGDSVTDKVTELYSKSRSNADKDRINSLKDAKEVMPVSGRSQRSVSVNDIRKAFEKTEAPTANGGRGKMTLMTALQFGVNGNHVRVSSLDSTNSEDSCAFAPGQYGSSSNLHREQFGSITSLASSTSLISPQELQLLIDEANQTLEESGGCSGGSSAASHDVLVVILHRDTAGGSVGITLAGGADYESKEITVHKVLTGSPADRDGRIQKGDRILSINGKSMKGVTHRESLAILKSPRPEVVLVVSRPKSDANCDTAGNDDSGVATALRTNLVSGRPPRILEGTTLNDSGGSSYEEIARGPPVTFILVKDGAGLGFSLEGGKDSPVGDKPLIIKKIFTGGAAEKCGNLKAGDEILNVNGIDVTLMSRIEAWKLMKRIPDGNVSITVRHQVENRAALDADRRTFQSENL